MLNIPMPKHDHRQWMQFSTNLFI